MTPLNISKIKLISRCILIRIGDKETGKREPAVRFRDGGFINASRILLVMIMILFPAMMVSAGEAEVVSIAAVSTTPQPALLDIALDRGFFSSEGLDVKRIIAPTGKHALDMVLAGRADLAAVAETPIMAAIMDGRDIVVITGIFKSDKSEMIIARKDAGIVKPEDLKGKRVGLTMGTSQAFFFDIFLARHGIPRKAVTVVNMKPREYTQAFLDGKVGAIVTSIPRAPRLKKKMGDQAVIFYGEGFYSETYNLVTTRKFAARKGDLLKKILRSLYLAEKYSQDQPAEAQKIVARTTGVEAELVRGFWPDIRLQLSLDQTLIANLEHQARWSIRNKLIRNAPLPDFAYWMAGSYLQEIAPARVTLY